MDTVQPILNGVTLSGLEADKEVAIGDSRTTRSILSRGTAYKGIKYTLLKIKGTYRRAVKQETPVESNQTEVIAPIFDTPKVIEEVVSIVGTPQIIDYSSVMEETQSVEETPEESKVAEETAKEEKPTNISNLKPAMDNISQQRGVLTPSDMTEAFVSVNTLIDSLSIREIKAEGNAPISDIGIPQLEPIPEYKENALPEEPEIQQVANMDLPVVEQDKVEEPEQDKAPIELEKPVDNNQGFSSIGPVPQDDLTQVLNVLDKKQNEDLKLLEANEKMKTDIEALRKVTGDLSSSLDFEEEKVRNLAERARQLEADKLQIEAVNSERVQKLETELASANNEIIQLRTIAKRVVESEKVADEYKHKYHLLRGKVYEFVKKSDSVAHNLEIPEEESIHQKAA